MAGPLKAADWPSTMRLSCARTRLAPTMALAPAILASWRRLMENDLSMENVQKSVDYLEMKSNFYTCSRGCGGCEISHIAP